MKALRTFAATIAALVAEAAVALTPGSAQVSMSFEIDGNAGKIVGTVTAPTRDSDWQALPEDTRMTVKVTRSCYSLSETDVEVATLTNLAPGEEAQFTDNATPAWQYGNEYTYTPVAYIGDEHTQWAYGASIKPGLSFYFAYNTFTATPAADAKSVELSVVVPSTLSDNQPIPVPITAIEFYRGYDAAEFVGKVENPEFGATVTYTDEHPHENASTIYLVRAVTEFGSAQTTVSCFVGFDVPYAPYPVNAEYCEDGIRVYWTAPDRGVNWGTIDPAKTVYNVYRCWGSGQDNRVLIAENISETEFVDTGEGMTAPLAVRYEVQSANNIGPGDSNYSAYDYSLIIGPDYSLPFVETFNEGSDKMWTYENSSYYARMAIAEEAEYGSGNTFVQPHSGSGLLYVNYAEYYYIPSGSTNSITSYKIDLKEATMPVLSYWYYAIPDNDVYIDAQISTNGTDFTSVSKTMIALDASEPAWKQAILPLADYAGKVVYLRLITGFTDEASSAIIDDIALVNYAGVDAIEAESDTDARTITLTWNDPSTEYATCTGYKGYVNGESVGSVEMPWVFEAPEYDVVYTFSVEALYDGVEVAPSKEISASVEAPEITEFTVGDYVFLINKESNEPTVWVKAYTGSRTIITLPERVNNLNVSYEVTEVLEAAFKSNASVASVVIPATYTTIGEEAFADCPQLMGVTIGAGVTEIKARAFAGCPALAQVMFMPTVPPTVAADAFDGIAEGCKGTAPEGTAETYTKTPGLEGIDFGWSGITDIEIESAAKVEYFDLNGRSIDAPVRGGCTIVRLTGRDGAVRTAKINVK